MLHRFQLRSLSSPVPVPVSDFPFCLLSAPRLCSRVVNPFIDDFFSFSLLFLYSFVIWFAPLDMFKLPNGRLLSRRRSRICVLYSG